MKKASVALTISLLLVAILGGGYWYYRYTHPFEYDARLKTALNAVQNVASYEEVSVTHTELSGRKIDISGLYRLNLADRAYASFATTTLTIPEEPLKNRVHVFTLENVALADEVYVRIRTTSELLKKTIPYDPEWKRFPASAIPAQYNNIAVAGPVLNDLALLQGNGQHLAPAGKSAALQSKDGSYEIYRFTLSREAASIRGGTLESLVQRIGTGTVDLWIDASSTLRRMTFHGDNYESTSTIANVNNPVQVSAPASAQ